MRSAASVILFQNLMVLPAVFLAVAAGAAGFSSPPGTCLLQTQFLAVERVTAQKSAPLRPVHRVLSEAEAQIASHKKVLFAVTSGRGRKYMERRAAVRNSWAGDVRRDPRADLRFFAAGAHEGQSPTADIQGESDLTVLPEVDSYHALTNKTVHLLQWALKHTEARYIVKVDDDVFLRAQAILDELDTPAFAPPLFWGRVSRNAKPERKTKNKYFVSELQYNFSHYPNFIAGNAYVMSRDVAERLTALAEGRGEKSAGPAETSAGPGVPGHRRGWLPLEDVQLGLWAYAAGVRLHDDPKHFLCCGDRYPEQACQESALAVHYVSPDKMLKMHRQFLKSGRMCLRDPFTPPPNAKTW